MADAVFDSISEEEPICSAKDVSGRWERSAKPSPGRWPRWHLLEQLLAGNRLLLADQDPVPPLLDQLTQIFREALIRAHDVYEKEHGAGMERLRQGSNWQRLTSEQRHKLLSEQMLTKVQTGTTQEVLASLRSMPLATWADRTAALPTRFQKVLVGPAELMEPDAVYVDLPTGTLRSDDEIRAWLKDLEALLKEKLKAAGGGPLIIQALFMGKSALCHLPRSF